MHIILYVLDALRADHLGCYGYQRNTSPNIDFLSKNGVLFKHCSTSSTWTRPVAASLLSGTYPAIHQTRSRNDMFLTNLPRLPEALKLAGFKTAAFSTMGNIASEIGFDRGFDVFIDIFRDPAIIAKRRKLDAIKEGFIHNPDQEIALPRAEDVNDYLFPWIETHRDENTFSFIWSIEPHVPYAAPSEFRRFSFATQKKINEGERDDIRGAGKKDRRRLLNLYDDEIYYNDYCIGEIIKHLEVLGIFDDTLFVIISDHGEAFFEHHAYTHGHAPYEEVIQVPLIIKFPDSKFAGKIVSGLVELIDLFPTLVSYVGVNYSEIVPNFLQGYNLMKIINGNKSQVRDYTYTDTRALDIHNQYYSVSDLNWKYIRILSPNRTRKTVIKTINHIINSRMIIDILSKPRHFFRNYLGVSSEQLYDLRSDPKELENKIVECKDVAIRMREVLSNWEEQNKKISAKVEKFSGEFDEDEIIKQHLEKLGYL